MGSLDLLNNLVGRKLKYAKYVVHIYGARITETLSVVLLFEGAAQQISLYNGSDGETLVWSEEHPPEMELGKYGRVETISINQHDPSHVAMCLNKDFSGYCFGCGPREEIRWLEMRFGGQNIIISNDGDILRFGEPPSRDMKLYSYP